MLGFPVGGVERDELLALGVAEPRLERPQMALAPTVGALRELLGGGWASLEARKRLSEPLGVLRSIGDPAKNLLALVLCYLTGTLELQ